MLTKEQIDCLFTFCEKHFVKYYEVQLELVDHLANAIKTKIDEDHKLSFEKVLDEVHESFGVRGFAPLVSEKQIEAEKQSRKLFWKLFKDQFRWPKTLGFLVLSAVMFTIVSFDVLSFRWLFVSIMIAGLVIEIYSVLKIHILLAHTGKKFLLGKISEFVPSIFFPFYVFYFPSTLDQNFLSTIHSFPSILFYSILLSLFIIMIIAILQTISSAKRSLIKSFPEVFPVN